MAAKRKVYGPYRVRNIGVNGDIYEVVCMADNTSEKWCELIPRYTSINRQPAFGKCLRLNQRWQADHQLDFDALEYWEKAIN